MAPAEEALAGKNPIATSTGRAQTTAGLKDAETLGCGLHRGKEKAAKITPGVLSGPPCFPRAKQEERSFRLTNIEKGLQEIHGGRLCWH